MELFEPGAGCPDPEGARAAFREKVTYHTNRLTRGVARLEQRGQSLPRREAVEAAIAQRLLRHGVLHCPAIAKGCPEATVCPLLGPQAEEL